MRALGAAARDYVIGTEVRHDLPSVRSASARLLRRSLVVLLIAATANTGLTWGLAAWRYSRIARLTSLADLEADQKRLQVELAALVEDWDEADRSSVASQFSGVHTGGFGFRYVVKLGTDSRSRQQWQSTLEVGWPWLSVGARAYELGAFGQERGDMMGRLVRPLWPGHVANSLLLALLGSGVWYGSKAVRRLRRARQCRCVRCGYPQGTSRVCSECGRQHPRPARVVADRRD